MLPRIASRSNVDAGSDCVSGSNLPNMSRPIRGKERESGQLGGVSMGSERGWMFCRRGVARR